MNTDFSCETDREKECKTFLVPGEISMHRVRARASFLSVQNRTKKEIKRKTMHCNKCEYECTNKHSIRISKSKRDFMGNDATGIFSSRIHVVEDNTNGNIPSVCSRICAMFCFVSIENNKRVEQLERGKYFAHFEWFISHFAFVSEHIWYLCLHSPLCSFSLHSVGGLKIWPVKYLSKVP